MKKLILTALVIALSVASAYALEDSDYTYDSYTLNTEDMNYEDTPVNKLGRGTINTTTFWAELPGQVCKISKEKDPVQGFTFGLTMGTIAAVGRGITGITDMVTCLFPPYNKPYMEPEYALNDADKYVKEYLW
jgi:putative exosortase-associated protein (TIGR04073 family)